MLAALFEVMDKEPPLAEVWALFLTLGIGGFVLCRYRGGLMALVLPLIVLVIGEYCMEFNDPYIGPAIVREAGQSYVIQSYVVMALAIALPFLGLARRKTKLP